MARHVRRFEIRSLRNGRWSTEIATSPVSAARAATKHARQGHEAEVIDIDRAWTAMVCRPERHGRRVVAACVIKEPFKRRIKFTGMPKPVGLAGVRRRKRPW